jgi:hypothetical protein
MHFPDQTARDPLETSETLRDIYILRTGDAARLPAQLAGRWGQMMSQKNLL